MEQKDGFFGSWLAGSSTDTQLPEWVDCDSEYVEAIEQAGLRALADEMGGPWTWHHEYMSKLPDAQRAALVALCATHAGQCLTWQEAASMLHTALGEPAPLWDVYGDCSDTDVGCDYEDYHDEFEREWDHYGEDYYDEDHYDEQDPSDYGMDMGYREDYDEDDSNWGPHGEQDDSEHGNGLSVLGDDEDELGESDDYDDEDDLDETDDYDHDE